MVKLTSRNILTYIDQTREVKRVQVGETNNESHTSRDFTKKDNPGITRNFDSFYLNQTINPKPS